MGRPKGKWPTYALDRLEDSLVKLKELEAKADAAQVAIVLGDDATAQHELGNVRALALKCVLNLVESRDGNYQQTQEMVPEWQNKMDDRATQAVRQAVAARRL